MLGGLARPAIPLFSIPGAHTRRPFILRRPRGASISAAYQGGNKSPTCPTCPALGRRALRPNRIQLPGFARQPLEPVAIRPFTTPQILWGSRLPAVACELQVPGRAAHDRVPPSFSHVRAEEENCLAILGGHEDNSAQFSTPFSSLGRRAPSRSFIRRPRFPTCSASAAVASLGGVGGVPGISGVRRPWAFPPRLIGGVAGVRLLPRSRNRPGPLISALRILLMTGLGRTV
jgi:hypothetical protein